MLLRRPYTSAVDDWAIGVIAFILLSGMMPFDDENKTRLYRTIINGDYNFNGDVSYQLRVFCCFSDGKFFRNETSDECV